MKILFVGEGAQAKALRDKIAQSPLLTSLMHWPKPLEIDNIELPAVSKPIDVPNHATVSQLAKWIRSSEVDLVILATDEAIASGLGNVLEVYRIPCFGPTTVAGHFHWDFSYNPPNQKITGDGQSAIRTAATKVHNSEECRALATTMLKGRDGIIMRIAAPQLGKLKSYCRSLREIDDVLEPIVRFCRVAGQTPSITLEEDTSGEWDSFHYFVHRSGYCRVNHTRGEAAPRLERRFYYFDTNKVPEKATRNQEDSLTKVEQQVLLPILQNHKRENIRYTGWLKIDVRWLNNEPVVVDLNCLPSRAAIEALAKDDPRDWLAMIRQILLMNSENGRAAA